MNTRLASSLVAALFALSASIGVLAAEPARGDIATHVRGTVIKNDAHGFQVKTASGVRRIRITPNTTIAGVIRGRLDQVQPGAFIGTANVANGDTARALEVVVFPPSMKGTGLGNYAWDLKPGAVSSAGSGGDSMTAGSAMTNGTVGETSNDLMASASSMTNGTVSKAHGDNGRTITVDYGNGRKTIHVPADVPVVRVTKASRSDVVPGAHVFVAGSPQDGTVAADRVIVGLHGVVPPM